MAGNGLLGTLVSLRVGASDAGPTGLGVVLSAYFGGLVLGTTVTERLLRAVGHIRAFAALAGIVCATTLALSLGFDVVAWTLARLLAGFCMAGLYTAVESWLNERATVWTRGLILAAYTTAMQLALAFGQLAVGSFDPAGTSGYVVVAMLHVLALVPVALTRTPQPEIGPRVSIGLRALYRRAPLGLVGAASAGAIQGILVGLGPIFALGTRIGPGGVGRFMAAAVLGGLVVQGPLGWYSDRVDRRAVLAVASAATVAAALALGWLALTDEGARSLVVGGGVLGACVFCVYPLSLAHAYDYLDYEEMVPAGVTLVAVYGSGAAAGPWLASELGRGIGVLSVPVGIATFALVPAAYGGWRLSRRPPAPEEARATYVPTGMPQTLPAGTELGRPASVAPPPPDE